MLFKSDPDPDEYVNTINKQNELNIGTDISNEVDTKGIIRETTADKVEEPLSVSEAGNKKDNYADAKKILVVSAVENEINKSPVDSTSDISKVKPKENQYIRK